jgi:hypothetical protein
MLAGPFRFNTVTDNHGALLVVRGHYANKSSSCIAVCWQSFEMDEVCRRLITTPGVALTYRATVGMAYCCVMPEITTPGYSEPWLLWMLAAYAGGT